MNNKANFISYDYIIKWTQVDSNVDPSLIMPYVMVAQDQNIQSCIGNALYVKLIQLVQTYGSNQNDWTTNGFSNYWTLLVDYIQPATAYFTVYHSLPWIWAKLTNKSVSEKTSDNSNPVDLQSLQYLRNTVKDQAEFSATRIREFIINNQSWFPEYFSSGNNLMSIKPAVENYFGGIYLGKQPSNFSKNRGYDDGMSNRWVFGC